MKFLILLVILTSCKMEGKHTANLSEQNRSTITIQSKENPGEYDLTSFDDVFNLHHSLIEISALGYYPKRNSFLTVNDEQGILYELSADTGEIISKNKFAKNGDYEGVEVIGDMAYIVKSGGTIYFYDLVLNQTVKIVKTELSRSNDIEGITYDPVANEILLSCKQRAMSPDPKIKGKNVVRFDLSADTLKAEPKIHIKDKHLRKQLSKQIAGLDLSKTNKEKMIKRVESFAPSGLAIHPISKELYILSSRGQMLVTISPQNQLQHIYLLDSKVHRKPEGICFTEEGNLYISNEGEGLKAKIYLYNYKA